MEYAPHLFVGFLVAAAAMVAAISLTILIWWGCLEARKTSIAAAVHGLGAVPLSISWSPRLLAPNGSPPQYKVQMRLPSGHVVTARCQCSLWTGVYWKDTPWLRLQPDPATLLVAGGCPRCGYTLRGGWHCCPNCGAAIASQPPPMPSTSAAPRD